MHRSFFDLIQQIKKKCTITEKQIQNELDLTQAEFTAMRLIRPGESLQNGVFSEKMGLSVSRGSRVINQLREKGYVTVQSVPENRRCHEIFLTQSGERVQARINDKIRTCENSFLSHLPAQMKIQVFDNLEYILDIMERHNYSHE